MSAELCSDELLRLKQVEREKRRQEIVNPYADDISDMKAFNTLQTAVWIYDPYSWRNIYANKKALELWNASCLEEFIGRDMTDSSESSDRKARRLCEKWSSATKAGEEPEPFVSDWTYFPNGQPVTCQMVFSPFALRNGRIVLLCEGRPATDETIAANIRRSMEVLRHTSSMVTLYDMSGSVVLTNIRAEYSLLPDLEGKPPVLDEEHFLPYVIDRSAVRKILDGISEGLPIDVQVDVELQGKQRVHHLYAVRIRDPVSFDDNTTVDRHLILINEHDITEWKLMQDWLNKLREVDRIKSEFLLTMSHEIRTPMNGVLGMVNLLLDSPLNSEQREYAMMAHRSAESLLSVINDVLDYSKIEAHKLELQRQPFNAEQLLEGATEPLITLAADKGLNLAFFVDNGVPPVLVGDPTRLRQILINVIGNSIKFTLCGDVFIYCYCSSSPPASLLGPPPPTDELGSSTSSLLSSPSLSSSLSSSSGEETVYLTFEITDTGVGLTQDEQVHLFEPFFQAESCAISAQAKHAGTGLGLAIVEQLVQLMNGVISVKSEKGSGTKFTFTLPFKICTRIHPELQLSSSSGGSIVEPKGFLKGVQALVVAHHPLSQRVLSHHLDWLGATSGVVPSASQALARLCSLENSQNESENGSGSGSGNESGNDSGSGSGSGNEREQNSYGLIVLDVVSDDLRGILNYISTSPRMASVLVIIVASPFQRLQNMLEDTKDANGSPLADHVVFVTQPLSRGKVWSAVLSAEVKRRNSLDASMNSDVLVVESEGGVGGRERVRRRALTSPNLSSLSSTSPPSSPSSLASSSSSLSSSLGSSGSSLSSSMILTAASRSIRRSSHTPLPRRHSDEPVRRVLVAEDNIVNQKVVAKHLENMGLAVDIANDGEEAILLVQKNQRNYYAAILMDLFMPNKTGFEATEAIRKWEKEQNIPEKDLLPIIALTASVMPDIQEKCHLVGMTDFLSKPWHRQKFIDTIHKNCWRDML